MARASIGRSSAIMAAGSFASRILGMVRAAMITATIGTLAAGDAFGLANTLPNVLYLLAAGGVINAFLIPSLARAMKNADGGQDFTDRIITLSVVGMAVVTVLLTALSVPIVRVLAGDQPPQYQALAVMFSVICMPQVFFYGLYALLGQILNARDRFAEFAWAPFIANVVAIAGLVVFMVLFTRPSGPYPAPDVQAGVCQLAPHQVGGGPGANGGQRPWTAGEWTWPMVLVFAGSATLSVVAQAMTLVMGLRRAGFHYRPRWGVRGAGLGGASRMALWAFFGLAISQLGFFVNQWVLNTTNAAACGDPNVRGFAVYGNIAFPIFMLPHAFVTVSIVTALYPRLAHSAADGDLPGVAADFRRGLLLCLVALIPAAVLILVAGGPLVGFIQPSADPRSTTLAVLILGIMIIGIIPFGLDLLCYRTLFALQDGRSTIVMALGLLAVGVAGAVLAVTVRPIYAVGILAMAQTLSNTVSSTIGVVRIRRQVGALGMSRVVVTSAKLGAASVAAGLVAWAIVQVASPLVIAEPGSGVLARMLTSGVVLALAGGVFAAIYLSLAHALRVTEVRDLTTMVRSRLGARR